MRQCLAGWLDRVERTDDIDGSWRQWKMKPLGCETSHTFVDCSMLLVYNTTDTTRYLPVLVTLHWNRTNL